MAAPVGSRCPLAGEHQVDNAVTAVQILRELGIAPDGISEARWPGRLECVSPNPDVILDASMMGTSDSKISGLEQRLRQPWLEHHELKAVQNGAIFGLTSEVLVTPGPRVAEAVHLIRARIRIGQR